MKNFLSKIFKGVTFALLILSAAAIILTQVDLAQNYQFEFSVSGITYYLLSFGKFKELYLGTIAIAAGYVGIKTLEVGIKTLEETIMENRYRDWSNKNDFRLMEYLKNNYSNDKIREIFTCYRRDIFDELYEKKFCINNKKELKSFIDKYFAPNIDLLEQSSELFFPCNSLYPNANTCYSIDCVTYLFKGLINLDKCYPEIIRDFTEIYLNYVKIESFMIQPDEYYKLRSANITQKKSNH